MMPAALGPAEPSEELLVGLFTRLVIVLNCQSSALKFPGRLGAIHLSSRRTNFSSRLSNITNEIHYYSAKDLDTA